LELGAEANVGVLQTHFLNQTFLSVAALCFSLSPQDLCVFSLQPKGRGSRVDWRYPHQIQSIKSILALDTDMSSAFPQIGAEKN